MRTVTFSKKDIQRRLDRDYRLAWLDLSGQKSAGASFAHAPDDPAGTCVRGAGDHNVQILFTTPDGELLDAVAGYLGPDELAAELDFVDALLEKTADIQSPKARRKMVEFAHRKAAAGARQAKDDDIFADLRRHRLVKDHEYCIRRALSDAGDFEPTEMVGQSSTFFGSRQGSGPMGRIGEMPRGGQEFDLEKMLQDLERGRQARPADRDEERERGRKHGGPGRP
ncbi:MAG: hypothetical protein H6807_14750 [Planctomycetes bacterium]|nr:hypothetical protein [Planctomycetota bacterium]